MKDKLVRLAIAASALALLAFFGGIGEIFTNGLKWG